MKFRFQQRPKQEKVRIIVVSSIVFVLVFVAIFSGIIFPGSKFADIIENSIGKFFNLFAFL